MAVTTYKWNLTFISKYIVHCRTVKRRSIFAQIFTKTPHSSSVRARYGVSVVDIASGWYSASVFVIIYVTSYNIRLRYNGIQLFITVVSNWQEYNLLFSVNQNQVSEWVIKFNGLSRTADSEVHIVHISRVIIACTLKSLSFPHRDNTQSTSYK